MSRGTWTAGAVLAPFTSWRVGGPCRAFAEPKDPTELLAAWQEAERQSWPVFFLGGGSNILVADEGFPGLVVRYAARAWRLEPRGDTAVVRAEARMPLAGLARDTGRKGWDGLVWAEGIPGTIGGAVVGNAGAYGSDIARVLTAVEVIHADGTQETWPTERMAYGYRTSVLKHGAASPPPASGHEPTASPRTATAARPSAHSGHPAVVAAHFVLRRGDPAHLESEIQRIAEERRAKTPVGASCGSVFRNPEGTTAGKIIDSCGCKGMRRGGAVVSAQHANYIVNDAGATAADIRSLIEDVRARVFAETGVRLVLEVQLVGFAPDAIG
jgi:UDP-N-acetylmuramate dehydrogenase